MLHFLVLLRKKRTFFLSGDESRLLLPGYYDSETESEGRMTLLPTRLTRSCQPGFHSHIKGLPAPLSEPGDYAKRLPGSKGMSQGLEVGSPNPGSGEFSEADEEPATSVVPRKCPCHSSEDMESSKKHRPTSTPFI